MRLWPPSPSSSSSHSASRGGTRFALGLFLLAAVSPSSFAQGAGELIISKKELRDRIKGAWTGKSAGICIGGPYEFSTCAKWVTGPINLSRGPYCTNSMDDIYVSTTFVDVMRKKMNGPKGIFEATMQDYGKAFTEAKYELWCANHASRENMKKGILPPKSGMWAGAANRYNNHADDLDWQIECDWIGMMTPGMPRTAVRLSDSVGRVMAYGDGLYGGHFVVSLVSLAYVEKDVKKLVKRAMESMPRQSQYYRLIADLLRYHDQNPAAEPESCWNYLQRRWQDSTAREAMFTGKCIKKPCNIAASYNGALIVFGLLYGKGDLLKSMELTTRAGHDADCNAGHVGGVIGAMKGFSGLPADWQERMNRDANKPYPTVTYSHDSLVEISYQQSLKAITSLGGRMLGDTAFAIKVEETAQPAFLEQYGFDPVPNPFYQATALRAPAADRKGMPGRRRVQILDRSLKGLLPPPYYQGRRD